MKRWSRSFVSAIHTTIYLFSSKIIVRFPCYHVVTDIGIDFSAIQINWFSNVSYTKNQESSTTYSNICGTGNYIGTSYKVWLQVLQSLLAPFNYLDHFSILARIKITNPSHSKTQMISSSYREPLKFIGGGPILLHMHSRLSS